MDETDFAECQDCLCFAARRAARSITQLYDRHLRGSGLRATQFTLLSYLLLAGPRPVQEAAEYMGLERTTLTRNLKVLLAQGDVALNSGEDRRVKLISITPRGRAKAAAALPLWRKAQRAVKERLPPAAARTLAAIASP
jgi:DNA-binding MarR family transcriptional regulator